MFATFLCMNERSGSHCVAGHIIAGGRRWRRRGRSVTVMTEAYADKQTDSGTEERPKDGVEDRPATYSGRQHRSGLRIPWIIETRHWLATSVRRCVQLTTEIIDSLTIPQTVTGTFM